LVRLRPAVRPAVFPIRLREPTLDRAGGRGNRVVVARNPLPPRVLARDPAVAGVPVSAGGGAGWVPSRCHPPGKGVGLPLPADEHHRPPRGGRGGGLFGLERGPPGTTGLPVRCAARDRDHCMAWGASG